MSSFTNNYWLSYYELVGAHCSDETQTHFFLKSFDRYLFNAFTYLSKRTFFLKIFSPKNMFKIPLLDHHTLLDFNVLLAVVLCQERVVRSQLQIIYEIMLNNEQQKLNSCEMFQFFLLHEEGETRPYIDGKWYLTTNDSYILSTYIRNRICELNNFP